MADKKPILAHAAPQPKCEHCGKEHGNIGWNGAPLRFCSIACRFAWIAANRKAVVPWNKGRTDLPSSWNKGISCRHSPATQFKKGQRAGNHLPVGSVTIRVRKRDGQKRAWVKVAEPSTWKLRAVIVWESANGPLPRGKVVHHKDRNTLNDDIANLEALTRREHLDEHLPEFEQKMREAAGNANKERWSRWRHSRNQTSRQNCESGSLP